MVEPYNVLSGSQTDINRRLLHMIEDLQTATGTDTTEIDELQETVGDENSGLVKDVNTLKSDVGASDSAGLKKRCKDIETEIGTDETADSIKGRLYALEHPANNG